MSAFAGAVQSVQGVVRFVRRGGVKRGRQRRPPTEPLREFEMIERKQESSMSRQIGYVIGSLRKESINRKLVNALIKLGPPDFNFKELRIGDLPLYNQDDDKAQAAVVQRLKSELRAVDAVMFVTAEYNRSIPGVLKNALDHASRPYGQNAWSGKPAGIVGASIGAVGTGIAQSHLRTILAYLDMPTLGQPEVYLHVKEGFFDEAGNIANAETRKFLHGWMDKYIAWVKKLTG
jgi:chromate reductase, NAD(P)H dehydrogenase (quinone)